MKKILSMIIVVALVMTSGLSVVFAGSGHSKGHWRDTQSARQLKEQLKKYHNDIKKSKELLKDISKLKKKYGDTSISVYVNGEEVICDTSPVLKSGKVLLPLKPIIKALKATYTYDPKTKTIVITKGDIKITLTIGSDVAVVNNTRLKLEYKVEMSKNGIMIPMGLISRILKQKVDFDKDSDSVVIEDDVIAVNDNTTGAGNSQFEFTGTWNYGAQADAYYGDNHWSSTTDSSFQVRFYGTKIKLFGAKASAHGKAYISIDGGTEILVDYYCANRSDNTLIFESSGTLSENRQHILKVRVAGIKNDAATGYTVTADRVDITECALSSNLALNKTATASSVSTSAGGISYAAANAVDGNAATSWSSEASDSQWISVDLGQPKNIGRVKLSWDTAYGKVYLIQASNDGSTWSNLLVVTNGDGGVDDSVINTTSARYVRILGIQRGTQYGYSLKEFEVYEGSGQLAGTLTGSAADVSGNVDLTAGNVTDWANWGYNSTAIFNHKTGITQQIGNYTPIGTSAVISVSNNPVLYSWSGGTPTASAINLASAIYYTGVNNGFQFTVPADTTVKTLKVYVSAWSAKGKLEAVLSDGSALPYTEYIDSTSNVKCKLFVISFKAASAGQTLSVKYTMDKINGGGLGFVSLQAATLK